MTNQRERHSCAKQLLVDHPSDQYAADGDMWECTCGLIYEHFCDEATGCNWTLVPANRA